MSVERGVKCEAPGEVARWQWQLHVGGHLSEGCCRLGKNDKVLQELPTVNECFKHHQPS